MGGHAGVLSYLVVFDFDRHFRHVLHMASTHDLLQQTITAAPDADGRYDLLRGRVHLLVILFRSADVRL